MKKSYSKRKKIQKTILIILTVLIIAIFVFPICIAILTSLKTEPEISRSVFALPESLYLENYIEGIETSGFGRALINTCLVTFPGVFLIVVCASMGGYAIARNAGSNRFFKVLDKVYLSSLMIPFQILMIPLYKIFKTLHLQNSLFGVVLVLTGISVAYATFLYVGFVKSIPRELEDAARIDGCGPYMTFIKIVFPLLKPISATVAALHVMWLWNDFNTALILLQKEEVRTLTVKQYYFFGEHLSKYGPAFATSILSMIPVVIFFIAAQKYLVEGIAAGSVKS